MTTKSYAAEYAESTKASRVAAKVRDLAGLSAVGSAYNLNSPLEFVLLDPSGEHAVVKATHALLILSRAGQKQHEFETPGAAYAAETGLLRGRDLFHWNAPEPTTLAGGPDETVIAAQIRGAYFKSVARREAPFSEKQMVLRSARLDGQTSEGDPNIWSARPNGKGFAAIAEDGRIALLMSDNRVLSFAAQASDGKAHQLFEVPLGPSDPQRVFYAVSFVENEPVLLQAVITEDTGDITDLVEGEFNHPFTSKWRTQVTVLNSQGQARARFELPFEALQPAIDGGGGRMYIVGRGIAALDHGKLAFSSPSATVLKATAFGDATLAVSAGKELRIVKPDGTIRQSLRTPNEEAIQTPPAIAADGSVYVATKTQLYVAR